MDAYFRECLTALRDAAQSLMTANEHIQIAGQALVRATEGALHANEEHGDLRESVHRLEGLVEELLRRRNGDEKSND